MNNTAALRLAGIPAGGPKPVFGLCQRAVAQRKLGILRRLSGRLRL